MLEYDLLLEKNGVDSLSVMFCKNSIIGFKWIKKDLSIFYHQMFNITILELSKLNPKLSFRKMKAQLFKKYNLNVSVGQYRFTRKHSYVEKTNWAIIGSTVKIDDIIWLIIAVENEDTWKWFLDLIMEEIGIGHELAMYCP
uniref:Uncharacterized protein n=1 Tax=Lactuca sativa TaxID=4236 RepID=A0A9R1VUV4_LACSA|nr:hypothetical protein LSAT_V11C400190560 [Lactuca sativa]